MRIDVNNGEMIALGGEQNGAEITIGAREDLAPILKGPDQLRAIRIDAGTFGDGSVFSQARLLRRLGFLGHLCAKGSLIPDQLHMARGAGIDVLEPNAEILLRHDSSAWRNAARRFPVSYLARLKEPACQSDRGYDNA